MHYTARPYANTKSVKTRDVHKPVAESEFFLNFNHKGNAKLGPHVSVVSRPVGDTCPVGCPFLKPRGGCYAKIMEARRPNNRKSALANLNSSANELTAFLFEARANGNIVRIHERGDFLKDGKLDISYLNDWKIAIGKVRGVKIWVYTHVYHRKIAALSKLGVAVYASIHTDADMKKAKAAGFTLFAIDSGIRKNRKNRGKQAVANYMSFPSLPIVKALVCPEQRRGDMQHITCQNCGYCVNGRGHVAFLKH